MVAYTAKIPWCADYPCSLVQEIDASVLDKDEIEAKELQPEGTAVGT